MTEAAPALSMQHLRLPRDRPTQAVAAFSSSRRETWMTSFRPTPERDFHGYGRNPPHADWPGNARIAVQFILNYEEGAERSVLSGDPASESFLSDVVNAVPWPGQRHMTIESMYEYGTRAGFWRVWRILTARGVPATVNAVAQAIRSAHEPIAAMKEASWEIACHALRWIDYRDVSPEEERAHIREAIRLHTEATGTPPLGWYTGRNTDNTLRLVMEEGEFLYSADSYADDLPYWTFPTGTRPHLVIPYALDTNDMRFVQAPGFATATDFFQYLRDSFDMLYEEGAERPKLMSVGLHCRLIGRPGRAVALARFIDYVQSKSDVWIARRADVARHWHARHPVGSPQGFAQS